MRNKIHCSVKEQIVANVCLKVKSDTVFDDKKILSRLNNPEFPIAFKNDFLLLELELCMGVVGIQGSISLLTPPMDYSKDIEDPWDHCRKAKGQLAAWSFLSLQYQYDQESKPLIAINYDEDNFFEINLIVYKMFLLDEKIKNDVTLANLKNLLSKSIYYDFPEGVGDDFDYESFYIKNLTENILNVLKIMWDFDVIDNPMED